MRSIKILIPLVALLALIIAVSPYASAANLTLNTTSNPVYAGLVTPLNGTHPYGTQITITASPIQGWTLLNWSCTGKGCYNGTSPTASIILTTNTTEIANFGQIGQPTPLSAQPAAILTRATTSTTTVPQSAQSAPAAPTGANNVANYYYVVILVAIFVIVLCLIIYSHSRKHVAALQKQQQK